MTGKIYIVATPIGNLGDITFRAIDTLKSVDAVLCEDTRMTGKLLNHYEIKKPLIRADAHTTQSTISKAIELLQEGKNLALVSDAGTPCISDPGVFLIKEIIAHCGPETIVPIPGASAVITALCACGIPCSEFTFLGFLPHKKGRQSIFEQIKQSDKVVVFYESTHRLKKTLVSLSEIMPERHIVLAKELTKMHESFINGTAGEIIDYLDNNPKTEKGEFVLIVAPE